MTLKTETVLPRSGTHVRNGFTATRALFRGLDFHATGSITRDEACRQFGHGVAQGFTRYIAKETGDVKPVQSFHTSSEIESMALIHMVLVCLLFCTRFVSVCQGDPVS